MKSIVLILSFVFSCLGAEAADCRGLNYSRPEWLKDTVTSAVEQQPQAELIKNVEVWPNPFGESVTVRFLLTGEENVRIHILALDGRIVSVIDESLMQPGYHTIEWNAFGSGGLKVESGVYILRLNAGSFNVINKLVYVR